jgi:hypothetical protein
LYNTKWQQEPVDQKIIQEFLKETKPMVAKCSQNYCDIAGFASTQSRTKSEEFAKTNSPQSVEYSRAFTFLKVVEKNCK